MATLFSVLILMIQALFEKPYLAIQQKSGARAELENQEPGFFPGGSYDGTYIQDYEFNQTKLDAGTCDLDECNGMTIDGTYGYYVTDSYPWVLKNALKEQLIHPLIKQTNNYQSNRLIS